MPKRKSKAKVSSTMVAFLVLMLLVTAFLLQSYFSFFSLLVSGMSGLWLIPGFEGAKCTLAGAVPMGWTDWDGYNQYTPYERGARIAEHDAVGSGDQVYWAGSDAQNALIVWDHGVIGTTDRLQMLVETQQQVELENLNAMGDPLDWNTTEFFNAIQYQPNQGRSLNKTVDGSLTYYNFTKQTIILTPAEIHISISIPPSNDYSTHASGWQEGEWPNLELWFRLDFATWNTLANPYASIDRLPESETDGIVSSFEESPMTETNIQQEIYNNKGGFPIAGWVQGYLENVGPDWPEDYDDEIWDVVRSDEGHNYYLTEKTKAVLDAKTQTLPSLIGRAITLFSSADDPWEDYEGDYTSFLTILEQARVYDFVPAQVPAYFPIMVQTLGTHAEQHGVVNPYWDLYYPAVNYRIRVIYAVYGTFTYLWTVQTAQDQGYPGWETREYEWIQTQDWWEWLKSLFDNPLFVILFTAFILIIAFVLIATFAPWAITRTARSVGGAQRSYHEAKYGRGYG